MDLNGEASSLGAQRDAFLPGNGGLDDGRE